MNESNSKLFEGKAIDVFLDITGNLMVMSASTAILFLVMEITKGIVGAILPYLM